MCIILHWKVRIYIFTRSTKSTVFLAHMNYGGLVGSQYIITEIYSISQIFCSGPLLQFDDLTIDENDLSSCVVFAILGIDKRP